MIKLDEVDRMARIGAVLGEVAVELDAAMAKFPRFNGAHEGYAVLLEEVDELWHEVKHGTSERSRAEAIQVAAMAVRFLLDVCEEEVTVPDTEQPAKTRPPGNPPKPPGR